MLLRSHGLRFELWRRGKGMHVGCFGNTRNYWRGSISAIPSLKIILSSDFVDLLKRARSTWLALRSGMAKRGGNIRRSTLPAAGLVLVVISLY